jgi:hypothetical protein
MNVMKLFYQEAPFRELGLVQQGTHQDIAVTG